VKKKKKKSFVTAEFATGGKGTPPIGNESENQREKGGLPRRAYQPPAHSSRREKTRRLGEPYAKINAKNVAKYLNGGGEFGGKSVVTRGKKSHMV